MSHNVHTSDKDTSAQRHVLKFAYDLVFVSCEHYNEAFFQWNLTKTKDMGIDFRTKISHPPSKMLIDDFNIKFVENHQNLGRIIDNNFALMQTVMQKGQQHVYSQHAAWQSNGTGWQFGTWCKYRFSVYILLFILFTTYSNVIFCYLLKHQHFLCIITYSLDVCGSICRDLACACIFFFLSLFFCGRDICGYKPLEREAVAISQEQCNRVGGCIGRAARLNCYLSHFLHCLMDW